MEMPLQKLLDIEVEKYKIARAAMQVLTDLSTDDLGSNGPSNPAIYALAKILNEEYTYEVEIKKYVPRVEDV
ncbi:MAG TPA: hypothetical protein ENI73_05090 [Spirochaetes bacterium]|nr:hypothetical protein [Spirochaetota bacterium]